MGKEIQPEYVLDVGEGGSSGRLPDPQVNELSVTAAEAVDDLPERIRSGRMVGVRGGAQSSCFPTSSLRTVRAPLNAYGSPLNVD